MQEFACPAGSRQPPRGAVSIDCWAGKDPDRGQGRTIGGGGREEPGRSQIRSECLHETRIGTPDARTRVPQVRGRLGRHAGARRARAVATESLAPQGFHLFSFLLTARASVSIARCRSVLSGCESTAEGSGAAALDPAEYAGMLESPRRVAFRPLPLSPSPAVMSTRRSAPPNAQLPARSGAQPR